MLLKILSFYLPTIIKKQKIRQLFLLTADAFQGEAPNLTGLSCQELLLKYALFTKEQVERSVQGNYDLDLIKTKLFQNAYQMGKSIRKSLNIAAPEEVRLVIRIIYSILSIDFHIDLQGNIIIKKCFFSKFYSSEVCQFISSLDEGLAAGLANGKLQFSQRITEGNNCCKAHLEMERVQV
jgi:hypothetical protein